MDETELAGINRQFEELNRNLERSAMATESLQRLAEDGLRAAGVDIRDFSRMFSQEGTKMERTWKDTWHNMTSIMDRNVGHWIAEWRRYFQDVDRMFKDAPWTKRALMAGSAVGGALGLTSGGPASIMGIGGQGITGVMGQLRSQIMGQLPFGAGGILGLIFYGSKRSEEFRTAGANAAFMINQVGTAGSKAIGKFSGLTEELAHRWEEDVAKNAVQQTVAGFSSIGVAADGLSNRTLKSVMAMDNALGQDFGTTVKMIGELMAASGQDFDSAKSSVDRLGTSLKGVGLNVGAVLGQFLQMTAALRIQRQSVTDLGAAFAVARKGVAGTLGLDPRSLASGQIAMAGLGGLSGGFNNLNVGMKGYLAERVAGRLGTGMQGWDAIRDLELGLSTGGKGGNLDHFKKFATVFGETLMEVSPNRGERYGFMRSQGFDPEAIITMESLMEDGFQWSELSSEQLGNIQRGFQTRDQMQNQFNMFMQRAMLDIMKLGDKTLVTMWTGFQALLSSIDALGTLPGSDARKTHAVNKRAFEIAGSELFSTLSSLGGTGADALKMGVGADRLQKYYDEVRTRAGANLLSPTTPATTKSAERGWGSTAEDRRAGRLIEVEEETTTKRTIRSLPDNRGVEPKQTGRN